MVIMEGALKRQNFDSKENTDVNKITNKSILIFTLHRSGSMFIHRICLSLANHAGIPYYSPQCRNFPETEEVLSKEFWEGKSGWFGPIRWLVDVPNMDDYNVILHLRDPRDVLVSMFYSYCYSHKGQVRGHTDYRKQVADEGIDSFVLNMSSGKPSISRYGTGRPVLMGNILERYQNYTANLLAKPDVILLKYEEMVTDFGNWLSKFLFPFDIANKDLLASQIEEQSTNEFNVSKENVWEHKRRATPGDYKEKLKPETIAELNKRFKDVLATLNYSVL
jgi:hypothetical protein